MQVPSIFGAYAQQLQIMINRNLDVFEPTLFQQYMDWGPQQPTLTYRTIIGRTRIEAAASIVNRDSKAPLRSRNALEMINGDIPAIKEKIKMSETDYRNYLLFQALNTNAGANKQQLLDLLFSDVRVVGNAAMKKIDLMFLEGLSTGYVTVTPVNNPDGTVAVGALDLGMNALNRKTAAITWATAATATPIDDIVAVVEDAMGRGIKFSKILMNRSTWLKLIATVQIRGSLTAFLGIRGANTTIVPTLDVVNNYMQANGYPVIEIIQKYIGVEKDGVITTVEPFVAANIVFVPDGKLGIIHNAIAIEEMRPVEGLSYAKFNNALISKWSETEPFGEYTRVELNAFPGFDAIDNMYIMNVIF
jgi:hypothetical protein